MSIFFFKSRIKIGAKVLIPTGEYPILSRKHNDPLQRYETMRGMNYVVASCHEGVIEENFDSYDMPDCVAVRVKAGSQGHLIEVHYTELLEIVK